LICDLTGFFKDMALKPTFKVFLAKRRNT